MSATTAMHRPKFLHRDIPDLPVPRHTSQYARMFWESEDTLSFRVIWVTPEWASEVLAKLNTRNRGRSVHVVTRLRDVIRSWSWLLNGEPIIFDTDGRLVNGQHRLHAVMESCEAVPMCAVFGVSPQAFDSMDQGKKRTGRDVLTIPTEERPEGETDPATLAAVLNWVHRWEREGGTLADTGVTLANNEFRPLLARHPQLRESLCSVVTRCTHGVHNPSVWITLHYLLGLSNAKLRDAFFEKVLDGVRVEKDTHESVLIRWLKNKVSRGYTTGRNVETFAVAIKTWNRILNSEPALAILSFRDGETFPEIV